jgi:hypothetical protein
MEVYWWEKRGYIQQGWGKLEGSKSKNGVCSETNASDPIIGYPRAPHLTTNNEPCPIYQFCDLERIKKTYWYLIQKKRALSRLIIGLQQYVVFFAQREKNRSAAVNPHRTSSSRGDLQSVLQVDNPTCARTL